MRDYTHTVEQDFIQSRLERFQSKRREVLWRRIREQEVDLGFISVNALQAHFEAICCAWALEDDEALAECRGLMSDLTRVMLDFPAPEIHTHVGYTQLSMVGLGDARDVLVDLAENMAGRPHEDPEGMTSAPASHWLADSVASLITGDDATSRQAADKAATEYDSPATPPGDPSVAIPGAIKGVIEGDQEALALAAADSIELFTVSNAPTATQRAAPNSLIHASLSVVGRVAGWRDVTMPPNPYLVPMPD